MPEIETFAPPLACVGSSNERFAFKTLLSVPCTSMKQVRNCPGNQATEQLVETQDLKETTSPYFNLAVFDSSQGRSIAELIL